MLADLKKQILKDLSLVTQVSPDELFTLLEVPKDIQHGHLSLPVFFLAKRLKKSPILVAKEFAPQIEACHHPFIQQVEAVGGFINIHFYPKIFQDILLQTVHDQGDQLGFSSHGAGKKVVIDFSSPNVAKPMSIGHLRATVIGQSIAHLARTQGYEVIGLNHLGDWGVQFGKLAWAYLNWGKEYDFEKDPFRSLLQIYVRFHQQAEEDESLNNQGALMFKKLEAGDSDIQKIWKNFVEISLKEYTRLWNLLGVKHDLVRGESFYNDKLKSTEQLLEDKGLLVESEGAMVVRLDEHKLAPCLIRKSDGASLYATRDLASAIYRHNVLHADLNLYVVGEEQTLHFRQLFHVLEKMGFSWVKDCHHIVFGLYRFKDGRMSTRKGNVVLLEDILTQAIGRMRDLVEEKNPHLTIEQKETIARQVGVGAVIFNDLANDRVKAVEFDLNRVLNFEGDSGPYVQYMNVRCLSVLRKYGKQIPFQTFVSLETQWEKILIRQLMNYADILETSFHQFKPHILAGYLLEVCQAFGQFYHHCRVLGEEESIEKSRVALVFATHRVLTAGLKVLNIEAPEVM